MVDIEVIKMDKHFIATTDPDTAKALRKLGF